MDLELVYEPETILEQAAFGFHCLLQKVARLIMIRRRNSPLKDDFFSEEYEPCFTRDEWLYFLTKIKSFTRKECVPAIAEIKGITTEAADAEFSKMMGGTFVPQTELEVAWQNAMNLMYDDILKLVKLHKRIRRENLADEEDLDEEMTDPEEADDEVEKLALSETKLQNSQRMTPREADDAPNNQENMTDPEEAAYEVEKLPLSETKLQNSQEMTDPEEAADEVKKLALSDDAVKEGSRATELELLVAELEALERLDVAKKALDKLLPEAFYEW